MACLAILAFTMASQASTRIKVLEDIIPNLATLEEVKKIIK